MFVFSTNCHNDESRAVLLTQNVHNMFICIAAHLYKQLKSTQYDNSVHNAGTNYAACPAANSHYVVTTPRRDCHLSTLPARPAPRVPRREGSPALRTVHRYIARPTKAGRCCREPTYLCTANTQIGVAVENNSAKQDRFGVTSRVTYIVISREISLIMSVVRVAPIVRGDYCYLKHEELQLAGDL